jgi:hypothetical protein
MSELASEQPQAGQIVIWPSCVDCRRRASLELSLTELPDGTFICPACQQRRALIAAGPKQEASARARQRQRAPRGSSYALLDVPMDATAEEIAEALKAQMRYWTERQAGDERVRAQEMRERLREASIRFKTADSRRKYDEEMLRKQKEERAALAEERIRPLEDWPGRQVSSLKDLVSACEFSPTNWRIGERKLVSRELLIWVRFAMGDEDTMQMVEDVLNQRQLSETRKLNQLLYRIDPERPFHVLTNPGAFETTPADREVATIPDFITFADRNWEAVVRHLYNGELITWLGNSFSIGLYDDKLYYSVAQFFDEVCKPFAGSQAEGVGLEALLEFLDNDLPQPQVSVTFDDQQDAYDLFRWDGELPHKPITVAISNTTRGYYAGQIALVRPEERGAPYVWSDFAPLPLAPTGASAQSGASRSHEAHLVKPCVLQGQQTQRYELHIGHFEALARGVTLQNQIALSRYDSTPLRPSPAGSYPVRVRLMRFRDGYRAKLWARGLRGSLPGAILDGAIGFGVMSLIFLAGVLLTPQASWGFFSATQDFAGQNAWPALLDVLLVIALRPFFLASATLGMALPVFIGVMLSLCGFFIGLRRGHTKFSAENDAAAHRKFGRFLSWCVWIAALALTTIRLLAMQQTPSLRSLAALAAHLTNLPLAAFSPTNPAFRVDQPIVMAIAALMVVIIPGVAVWVVMRLVVIARSRLYVAVKARWGDLLNPPGRA